MANLKEIYVRCRFCGVVCTILTDPTKYIPANKEKKTEEQHMFLSAGGRRIYKDKICPDCRMKPKYINGPGMED